MLISKRTKLKLVKWVSAITAVTVISAYSKSTDDVTECPTIDTMIEQKRKMDDPCLVQFTKSHRIKEPSAHPYNFSGADAGLKIETRDALKSYLGESSYPWVEALLAVEAFIPKRGKRTFVECGALDGITFSTTFHLENFLNWSGVLIEADPIYYERLDRRNRKAYTVQACASSTRYPSKQNFQHSSEYTFNKTANLFNFNPGMGRVLNSSEENTTGGRLSFEVLCIPMYTILLATGMTKVDLFVLDVEGMELNVLKTLPFESVEIGVLLVEINRPENEWQEYIDFFASKGYTFHGSYNGAVHPSDALFVKSEFYFPEKLSSLTALDAYKIVTGEVDELKISKERLLTFATYFQFSAEFNLHQG